MKIFSEDDQKKLLVISRYALADAEIFDNCCEALGISDEDMRQLSDRIHEVTEEDPDMKNAMEKLWDDWS